MKKLITNILVVSAFLISIGSTNSCSKVEDIIDITVPVPFAIPVNIETTIPFVVSTEYAKSPEIPLNLDLDAKIKEKFPSMSINNLKSAKLSSFSVDFMSSLDNNAIKLDKVKNAELLIVAPGLAEKTIATVTNNTSPDALNFTPNADVELMEYLKSKQSAVILKMQGSETAATEMKIRINASFKIQVGL